MAWRSHGWYFSKLYDSQWFHMVGMVLKTCDDYPHHVSETSSLQNKLHTNTTRAVKKRFLCALSLRM